MLPFVWIKSIGIKSTARKKERSGRPWKEKDNCWREAQGMGSEKEWTGKEKKGHTHILICSLHPVTPSDYLRVSRFLLDSSFSDLVSAPSPPHPNLSPPGTSVRSFVLCCLLSPFPSCGFHLDVVAGSHEVYYLQTWPPRALDFHLFSR